MKTRFLMPLFLLAFLSFKRPPATCDNVYWTLNATNCTVTVRTDIRAYTEHRISWNIDNSYIDADYIYVGTNYVLPLGGSGSHIYIVTVYDMDGNGTNCVNVNSVTCL